MKDWQFLLLMAYLLSIKADLQSGPNQIVPRLLSVMLTVTAIVVAAQ